MTPRHILLAAGGVTVTAMAVYLALEVRTPPAAAHAPRITAQEEAPEPSRPAPEERKPDRPQMTTDIAPPPPVERPGAAIGEPTPSGPPKMSDTFRPRLEKDAPTDDTAKLASIMAEANKAYDRGDLDDAKAVAGKVLVKDPTNARMLRILVSVACIEGDHAEAQKHYQPLNEADRRHMRIRCERYGVTFKE